MIVIVSHHAYRKCVSVRAPARRRFLIHTNVGTRLEIRIRV
jgi:hypothetical protein